SRAGYSLRERSSKGASGAPCAVSSGTPTQQAGSRSPMPSSLSHTLRHLWAREKFTYGVRVFIALAGAMALCWFLDRVAFVIPLFLGCIASALAESVDHWRG